MWIYQRLGELFSLMFGPFGQEEINAFDFTVGKSVILKFPFTSQIVLLLFFISVFCWTGELTVCHLTCLIDLARLTKIEQVKAFQSFLGGWKADDGGPTLVFKRPWLPGDCLRPCNCSLEGVKNRSRSVFMLLWSCIYIEGWTDTIITVIYRVEEGREVGSKAKVGGKEKSARAGRRD